ncbi:hypothetical protein CA7LBN_000939 [Candidozyma auris]|uniref:Uncharacterized protein n=1 Tax=Candidozyma auris TaxID=498019 RepID=A0A8F3AF06_CANAR|nr:hypothetical protein CA7LBN_000939 [[Candida] auris]
MSNKMRLRSQRLTEVSLSRRNVHSSSRRMDIFDELKEPKNEAPAKKNASTVFDIDELIANSPDLQQGQMFGSNYDKYAFGNTVKHPRDVAKELNVTGVAAGRTVDVKYGNVSAALSQLTKLVRVEKIPQMKQQQKRHLRPALLHDLKHRQWWRSNFSLRFSNLLTEILDAKRRGY